MRVIDSHVHFPENKIIDDGLPARQDKGKETGYTSGRTKTAGDGGDPKKHQSWLMGEKARWESAWHFPASEEVSPEEGERRWAEECAAHDFLHGVVFVTAGSNQFASELVARHPGRFYAYAHHDPMLPDAAGRLEKAIKEQGLRGYKILGPKVDRPLSDRSFDPIWEVAQASAGCPTR